MLPVLMTGKAFREERATGVEAEAEARQMLQRRGKKRRSDKGALMSVRLGCGAPGTLSLSAARPPQPPSSGAGLRWPWGVTPSPARNSGHSVLSLIETPHLGQAISLNLETSQRLTGYWSLCLVLQPTHPWPWSSLCPS